jgi:putative transposase
MNYSIRQAYHRHNVKPIVAIDPGVRIFGTCYDGDTITEWGNSDIGRIYRHCDYMDKLQSKIDTCTQSKRRKNMRLAWRRMFQQTINWVRDLHYRFAHWLCQNYRRILLPTYETHKMVRRKKRKIRKITARAMMNWRSASFKDILRYVSKQYTDCHVELVNEGFTTQTCGACGNRRKIGGAKIYHCYECGFICGRDISGARNILLRWLTAIHSNSKELLARRQTSEDTARAYI